VKVFNYSIGFNRQDAKTDVAHDAHTQNVRMAVAEEPLSHDRMPQLHAIREE